MANKGTARSRTKPSSGSAVPSSSSSSSSSILERKKTQSSAPSLLPHPSQASPPSSLPLNLKSTLRPRNGATSSHTTNNRHKNTDEHSTTTCSDNHDGRFDGPIQPSRFAYYIVMTIIFSIAIVYAYARLADPRKYIRIGTWWTWFVIYGLIFLTYYVLQKVRTVDPGMVDFSIWGSHNDISWYRPIEKKRNLTRRFCRKTQMFKPDRAHFCRSTNRLIKRYDHHCIFVDASIGHSNHKFFMLFLLYASLASITLALEILFHGQFATRMPKGMVGTSNFILFILGVAVSLSVFLFFAFHVYLIVRGYTTLEYTEKKGNMINGVKYVTPYNTSLFSNFSQVMGNNVLFWFLPTAPDNGDGTSYEVNIPNLGLPSVETH